MNTLVLGILAGAFIALGALFSTVAGTSTGLGFGPTRLLMGLSFSLGLILVVVGGAELFTGNNLIVMAWAGGKLRTAELLRNWGLVLAGNLLGAVATAWGVYLSGVAAMGDGQVAKCALAIAHAKIQMSWIEAFGRGVFCNALVCLSVWLGFSARSTTDRILCVLFPITAFVAIGFEHSIANMYLLPFALFLEYGTDTASGISGTRLSWQNILTDNLIPVTLGNIVGGTGLVGLVYWFVYLRGNAAK